MKYVTEGLKPQMPLQYFEELAAIPRGSGNEEAAAKWIEQKAKDLGLYAKRDEYNNVLVKKAATPGYEDKAPVLLQAHIDMVCEKNGDSDHDFLKDGLQLVVDGDWLRANGTTLGADDGYGCAYMLALMDSDSDTFVHPALEFLFTTGEELGFTGALPMDCSEIVSRRMIGMDGGPEGVVSITSAGAQEVIVSRECEYEPAVGECIAVHVKGLLGGHSAMNIIDEKGNSNKFMGRVLHNVAKVAPFRICTISGGAMFNAIPREASAIIAVQDGKKAEAIKAIETVAAQLKEEYAASDKDVQVIVEEASAEQMMSAATTTAVTESLYNIPNGVRMMNVLIPGLPVTSTNMGICKTEDGKVKIDTMLRSSSRSVNDDYVDNICSVARLAGMTDIWVGGWIPAWPYMQNSTMRTMMEEMYKQETGKDMEELAVHGGLELGVFSEKMPGMDIVTLGPVAYDAHTVTERMSISSFERVYGFLQRFLTKLAQ